MSTEKKAPHMMFIAVASIIYLAKNNFSRMIGNFFRDENDQKQLIIKLFPKWDEVLGHLTVRELSKEEVEEAIAQREAQWEELKSAQTDFSIRLPDDEGNTVITPSDKLRIFEKMYTNGKGKVLAPKYEGVYGFRRNFVLPTVNALRFKKGHELIEELPCTVKHYSNDLERVADCVRENTGKTDGAKGLDWKDLVRSSYELYVLGANESRLRQIYKAGTGQKLYALCTLNKSYPDLGIVDAIEKGELNPISWDKEQMREMISEKLGADEVLDYLKNPNGGPSPKKIMSRVDALKIAEHSECDIIKAIVTAIADSDVSLFKKLMPFHKELNKVTAELFRKPVEVKEKAKEAVTA